MSPRSIFIAAISVVLIIFLLWGAGSIWENVDADEIAVIQSPIEGTLKWCTVQGLWYQGFGKVTKYPRSFTFWFSHRPDQGKKGDDSIKTRFYDGGNGYISGSVRIDMPSDEVHLTALHTKFGSHEAIAHALVGTVFEKAVYMSGPLMSSKESYAEKRPMLIFYIEDQALHGVYQTTTQDVRMKDTLTGVDKTVTLTKIVERPDAPGGMARQQISPLQEFSLRAYNLAINRISYDDIVEKQITQQQEAIMAIQTAMAKAKEAEQDALTATKRGEANAATAKWKQETEKAQAVTKAQQEFEVAEWDAKQRLRVASLDKQAAEEIKLKEIALGEGESKRRQLLMAADNQLEKKLEYWLKAQEAYAVNFGKQKWVPDVQMGTVEGKTTGGAAADMINLLTLGLAKQIGLDMKMPTSK